MQWIHVRNLTLTAILPLAALLSSDAAAGNVLRVGPTQTYPDIQAAVNAAVNGDLILVDPGSYPPFDVNGVGVSILSSAGVPYTMQPSNTRPVIRVMNLPSGQSTTVAEFATTVAFGAASPLEITNCAGAVRIANASLEPTTDLWNVPMRGVIEVGQCASVAMFEVDVWPTTPRNGRTLNGVPAPGGTDRGIAAMIADNSNLHLVRCRLRGYDNVSEPPGDPVASQPQ